MRLQKIISISVAILLMSAGFFVIHQETNDGFVCETTDISGSHNNSTSYRNLVEFTQDELQLRKEVIQFKITFHHDDLIAVSSKMAVLYVDETITSAYCLLTNGEEPLLEPVCLWYVPERKFLVITPRIRLSVGKFWVIKLLDDEVGRADNKSGYFDVQAGDSWYLTLAVPTMSEKSFFSITLKSLTDSMEVTELTRHSNLDLYCPTYNRFSGKYYAIKFGVIGGGSICDISKEITVKDGSVIHMVVAGHRNGNMIVNQPNGEKKQLSQKGLLEYMFLGNESGNWRFAVRGWSIYFRMAIVLFYIDIDPYVRNK